MIISRLKLSRFKKFKNLDLTFAPGLNIVKGENEQGKSTLVDAFIAGLFYDPKKSNKDIRANQSWGEEKLYRIFLEFAVEKEKFSLTKDFAEKFLLLKNEKTGESWDTYNIIAKKIADLSGLSTPNLFSATACIRQDKIAELSAGKKELEKALQDVVTSGKEGVNIIKVLKTIEGIINKARCGLDRPALKAGIIKRLQDEISFKKSNLFSLKSKQDQVEAEKKKSKQLAEEKEKIEREGKVKSELLNSNRKIFELEAKRKSLTQGLDEIESTLSRAKELLAKKEKHSQELKPFQKQNLSEYNRLEKELLKLEALVITSKEKEKNLILEIEQANKKKKQILLIVSTLFLALGFLGFIKWWFFLAFILGGTFLIYVLFVKKEKKSSSIKAGLPVEKLQALLSQNQVKSIFEFQEKKARFLALKQGESEIEAEIKGGLGGKRLDEFEARKKKMAREIAIVEARKEEEGTQKMISPQEIVALEKEVEELRKRDKAVIEGLAMSRAIIQNFQDQEEKILELEEEIPAKKEELAQESKRLRVYETAYENLFLAKNEVTHSAKDRLEEDIGKYLPFITNGRYSKVVVSEDLAFTVESKEAGEQVKPEEHLSRGTIDQLYLAARFSLVKLMSEFKKPPLILDDPLVTFDEERKARAMDLIKRFSKEFQIFFFTYADTYDKWAAKVVELGR